MNFGWETTEKPISSLLSRASKWISLKNRAKGRRAIKMKSRCFSMGEWKPLGRVHWVVRLFWPSKQVDNDWNTKRVLLETIWMIRTYLFHLLWQCSQIVQWALGRAIIIVIILNQTITSVWFGSTRVATGSGCCPSRTVESSRRPRLAIRFVRLFRGRSNITWTVHIIRYGGQTSLDVGPGYLRGSVFNEFRLRGLHVREAGYQTLPKCEEVMNTVIVCTPKEWL